MYRFSRGVFRRPPELFVERFAHRRAVDGMRIFHGLLSSGRYSHVIVNYAWLTGMTEESRAA